MLLIIATLLTLTTIAIVSLYIYTTIWYSLSRTTLTSLMYTPTDIADEVTDGSVLFFSAPRVSIDVRVIGTALGTVFYHTGIVVTYNGRKMLLHFMEDEKMFKPEYICGDLCVSELAPLLARYETGTLVLRMTLKDARHRDWMADAKAVACQRGQEKMYTKSYFKKFIGAASDEEIHCAIFVGLLLERIGALPVNSNHQVYIPGRLLRAMHATSNFKTPILYSTSTKALPSPHSSTSSAGDATQQVNIASDEFQA